MRVLAMVVSVKAYQFKDEKDGRQVSGGAIEFLTEGRSDTTNQAGYKDGLSLRDAQVSKEVADRMRPSVPAVYELELDYVGEQGRIKCVCKGMRKVADADAVRFNEAGIVLREVPKAAANGARVA